MKKAVFLFLITLMSFTYAQQLPVLNLRTEASSYSHIGLRGLSKNDICVILGSNSPARPVTDYTVYIFKDGGKIAAYRQKSALSYESIELSEKNRQALSKIIQSGKFKKFLKYDQEDFEYKDEKTGEGKFPIIDTNYNLTVIQNGKQNTYSYLSKDYLKSDHPRINKTVLKKYAFILDMFRNVKIDKEH